MDSILNLPDEYARFNKSEKTLFDSVYTFSVNTGRVVIPKSMRPWVRENFGSTEAVENQDILRITNRLTLESAFFNFFWVFRLVYSGKGNTMEDLLADAKSEPFTDVEGMTPADIFGRFRGPHDLTASNVAKYDAQHGLVVFNNPEPVPSSEKETIGHFNTALKWISTAHKTDPGALFPVIAWNCLWKAGASLVHGHLQVLLAKGNHYPAMELLKKTDREYKESFDRSYFGSVFEIHSRLGLGNRKNGIRLMAHITPKKEKESILISDKADDALFSAIHRVLDVLTQHLGVESFNLTVMMPPLDDSWGDFPVLTRIIDRGPLSNRTTDVAAMELLLNQSVIAGDPAALWSAFRPAFGE